MLTYELLRSGQLNAYEIAICSIVGSFKNGSYLKIAELAEMTQISRRKVISTIEGLVQRKLLVRRYGAYKKLWLALQSEEDQRSMVLHSKLSPDVSRALQAFLGKRA